MARARIGSGRYHGTRERAAVRRPGTPRRLELRAPPARRTRSLPRDARGDRARGARSTVRDVLVSGGPRRAHVPGRAGRQGQGRSRHPGELRLGREHRSSALDVGPAHRGGWRGLRVRPGVAAAPAVSFRQARLPRPPQDSRRRRRHGVHRRDEHRRPLAPARTGRRGLAGRRVPGHRSGRARSSFALLRDMDGHRARGAARRRSLGQEADRARRGARQPARTRAQHPARVPPGHPAGETAHRHRQPVFSSGADLPLGPLPRPEPGRRSAHPDSWA